MTYADWAGIAATWGTVFFVAAFAVVLIYALWPQNQAKFDRAARLPLDDEKPLEG